MASMTLGEIINQARAGLGEKAVLSPKMLARETRTRGVALTAQWERKVGLMVGFLFSSLGVQEVQRIPYGIFNLLSNLLCYWMIGRSLLRPE
jgi:hypothetical protein